MRTPAALILTLMFPLAASADQKSVMPCANKLFNLRRGGKAIYIKAAGERSPIKGLRKDTGYLMAFVNSKYEAIPIPKTKKGEEATIQFMDNSNYPNPGDRILYTVRMDPVGTQKDPYRLAPYVDSDYNVTILDSKDQIDLPKGTVEVSEEDALAGESALATKLVVGKPNPDVVTNRILDDINEVRSGKRKVKGPICYLRAKGSEFNGPAAWEPVQVETYERLITKGALCRPSSKEGWPVTGPKGAKVELELDKAAVKSRIEELRVCAEQPNATLKNRAAQVQAALKTTLAVIDNIQKGESAPEPPMREADAAATGARAATKEEKTP